MNSNWDRTKYLYANIGKLITSSLDLKDILSGIMEEVDGFFGPEYWSLLRFDPATDSLFFTIIRGNDLEKVKHITLKSGEGIAGTVARTGQSLFVPDASSDPRFSDRVDRALGFKTESIIAVPLIFRDQVYGVIEIINRREGGHFTADEHLILRTIADFSAIAFANANLYEKALTGSVTDPLTGLYNLSSLNAIADEWAKGTSPGRRRGDSHSQAAVIFMDLNDFKVVNDTFGHGEGDRALVEMTRLLKGIFRKNDLLFRVGGDEFLGVIPCGSEMEHDMIERLEHDLSRAMYTSPEKGYTVSLAWGTATGDAGDLRNLITEADRLMYLNKEKGRSSSNTD